MTDDLTAAVPALWSQSVNRAFKRVEYMRLPCHDHFKTFVVMVTTNLALSHDPSLIHEGELICDGASDVPFGKSVTKVPLHSAEPSDTRTPGKFFRMIKKMGLLLISASG
jgi:hypothetical protein